MTYTTGTLSLEFLATDGTRRTDGTVLIVPSVPLLKDTTGHKVLSGSVAVKIPKGTTGPVTVDLPAFDDVTLDPTGVTYTVIPPKGWGNKVTGVAVNAGQTRYFADLMSADPAAVTYQPGDVTHAELLAVQADVTDLETTVNGKIPFAQKGAASGVAPLDAGSRVPEVNLPANLAAATLSATYAWQGQGLRPLRAACIGTSIYANGLATADNKVVDVSTSPAWDPTKMSRYMQGHGGKSWFTWMCLLSGGRILPHYNAAESGSTLTQQAARFQSQLVPQKPDVVFLGDATNDINGGITDAVIRGLITQQVGWALAANITPILVATTRRNDSTAKNQRVREHNEWLRRYSWANGYAFIDPFVVLVDPASTTGNVQTSLCPDGLHPNEAGGKAAGQRALEDLAGILPGNTNPARAKFIVQDRASSPNLLVNPLFQDDANADGKADSWGFGAGSTPSILTDARVVGKMQQIAVTSGTPTLNQGVTIGAGAVSVGDRVALSGLIEVDAATGSLQYNVGLYTLSQSGTWASSAIGYGGTNGGGPVGVDLPLSAFYCELVIPTGATLLRAEAKAFTGTGNIKLAQMRLVNLTTLGLDGLF